MKSFANSTDLKLTTIRGNLTLPSTMRPAILWLLVSILFPSSIRAQNSAAVPVFEITPVESKIKFDVEASVKIQGIFDKWNATLTFTSTDATTGVLDIKIQA